MEPTPGPYRVIRFGDTAEKVMRIGFTILSHDGTEIASTPVTYVNADEVDSGKGPLAEIAANAALLASAPDLLAALKRLLPDAVVRCDARGSDPDADPAIAAARRVLVKFGMIDAGKILGQRGGLARARKLSPERRAEIARNAAKSRWQK